jgi:RNA polymerase sigma-70 factor (ECF subfamily)
VGLALVANQPSERAELDDVTLGRAQRGDESAWRALVERYQRPVFALLSRMLSPGRRDAVEDLAQETFVRAFRALPGFDRTASGRLSSWLLTIATRLALDDLRQRRAPHEPLHADHLQIAGATRPDRRLMAEILTRAVQQLSPDHRAMILLREVHGLDYEEIAMTLAISVGTVRSRLSRARAELRAALGEDDDG